MTANTSLYHDRQTAILDRADWAVGPVNIGEGNLEAARSGQPRASNRWGKHTTSDVHDRCFE
jgi:hypothetical protein